MLTTNIKAGGCAAKLSPAELAAIVQDLPSLRVPELLTGMDGFEDAAVYRISDELAVIQTLDFFPPVVDDPFLYGRLAAVNALSDVYAMGGRPVLALNILGFPTCDFPLEVARKIVEGGAQAAIEAGVALAGGHSIQTREPIYGMSVMGLIDPRKILTNAGARKHDALVITKPIGTGVCLLAHKGGVLSEHALALLYESMCQLNAQALQTALKYEVHAATDVTGFGLIGHVHEMAQASGLKAALHAADVPLLPEAANCAEFGIVPGGAYANRKAYEGKVLVAETVDPVLVDLLFDPQTAGGLLFSCSATDAEQLVHALKQSGCQGAIIGRFSEGSAGLVEVS